MATYIQGLYDSPLAITPFTPDYNLIQNVLRTKEMEYEQGFAQVKNVYNSLLNAKVTNPEDREVQKAYIAFAEDKLKNLATVDLSLDQNVQIANTVFKPFQEDDELLNDINVTRISEQQTAFGQSLLNSDKEDQRKKHSAISDEFVRIPLDELRRAKRGDGSITAVRPRYYVPSVNLYEKFKDFLKVNGYKDAVIETTNGSGLIFSTSGGKRVEIGLNKLMTGLLTGDDRKYFDAWGEVLYNRTINEGMSRGLTLDQSRQQSATAFYNRDLDLFKDQKKSIEGDLSQINAKLEYYQNRSTKNGGLNPAEADALDSLKETKKGYEESLSSLDKQINALTNPQTKAGEIRKYYDGKSGILSQQLINGSIKSISSAMGILTESKEIKANEWYFKTLEHQRAMEQLEINWFQANTARMKADGDEDGGGGGGKGKTGAGTGKMSEADKKRAIANNPISTGYQKVPEPKDKLKTFWDNYNLLHEIMVDNGSSFLENILSKEFNSAGASASLGNLMKEIREKKANNQFTDLATLTDPAKANAAPDSPLARSFKRFNELYNTPQTEGGETDFGKYLTEVGKSPDKATFSDVYGFLFKKANSEFDTGKSAMDTETIVKLSNYLDKIAKGKELQTIFDKDQKTVETGVLTNVVSALKNKKYTDDFYREFTIDPNDIVVTDDDGFRRIKSKEELLQEYNTLRSTNDIIGYDTSTSTSPTTGITTTSQIPVYRNSRRLGILKGIIDNIDDISNTVKTLVSDQLSANKFTLDDKTLSTFGSYVLRAPGDVDGEIAEQAIVRLLSDQNLIMSGGDNAAKDAINVEQFKAFVKDSNKADIQSVIKEIANSATVTGGGWNNAVEYRQFTEDPGDKRKAYVIKFDGSKLDDLFKKYINATGDSYSPSKAGAIQYIKENGLMVRTNDPIPGSLSEYGLQERYHQANGYYETPAFFDNLFKFRIDKTSKGEYVVSSDSYYNVKDPNTGKVKQMPLGGIEFPPTASFTGAIELLQTTALQRILQNQTQLDRATKNKPNKVTYEQIMAQD